MEYRTLGRTGLRVSALCLGTWGFGEWVDEPTAHRLLSHFADAGGTFFDTAEIYGYQETESVLGRWLRHRDRDGLVIATKVMPHGPTWDHPKVPRAEHNERGLSRKHIMTAVDGSLRRLGTDYIDLYQIHTIDPTPIEEVMSTLDILVRSGKVRYLGASNVPAWYLQKSIDTGRHNGWEPYTSLQPLYNLLARAFEDSLLPVCENEGLGVLPWSPLHQGWLGGRLRRGMTEPPAGSRMVDGPGFNWEETAT